MTSLAFAILLLAACAGQDEKQDQNTLDTDQAVRDFITVRELKAADKMPNTGRDSFEALGHRFMIYKNRKEGHLVEFSRPCSELRDQARIVADERWDSNYIRSRFETFRGCRIHALYPLTDAELAELENIGESPGSRN